MTPNELRRLFPNASRSTLEANTVVSDASPEPYFAPALGNPTEREKRWLVRIIVRFTGYRVRPLDPDSFAGSTKGLIDGLRHAHLLPNDSLFDIQLETTQTKVKKFADEKTVIEIYYPK